MIILLYSWIRKALESSSFRMIYESRIKHCERLAQDEKEGVFAPTVPKVSVKAWRMKLVLTWRIMTASLGG